MKKLNLNCESLKTATNIESGPRAACGLRCGDDGDVFVAKVLRNTLDKVGLTGVGIIAADGDWSIADSLNADPHLSECVEVVG